MTSPRVLLFTGKGGVGKTTAAAAAALHTASLGLRTLVLSTDPAHSLADALEIDVAEYSRRGEAVSISENLFALQIDTQQLFEESWMAVSGYLRSLLESAEIDPIATEELTVLPCADEVLALLAVKREVQSGKYDVVMVDCAPTGETLRLLALPEILGWYIDKVLPQDRVAIKALKPVLSRVTGLPLPEPQLLDSVLKLQRDLSEVRDLLMSTEVRIRLVLTPERVVVAEARRALTMLSLYGYRVDGVLVNRVFPSSEDPWLRRWASQQQGVLGEVKESFGDLPQWLCPYQSIEPSGVVPLRDLAGMVYSSRGPLDGQAPLVAPLSWTSDAEGTTLRLRLPFVDPDDVDLARRGDELVLTLPGHRRILALPTSLAKRPVLSAGVGSGELRVRFKPESGHEALLPSQEQEGNEREKREGMV